MSHGTWGTSYSLTAVTGWSTGLHLMDRDTGNQNWVISPMSHNYQVADLGFEPRVYIPSTQAKCPLASSPCWKITDSMDDSLPWASWEEPCSYCLKKQWKEETKRASPLQCSQSSIPRPAAASPGRWLELQVLGPHPRPAESETQGWGQQAVF